MNNTETLVTIFTPAYNRGNLLSNLYASLLSQTNKNFEWIVVDDGSTDDTKYLLDSFASEAKIKIVYEYQENSGKHIAINRAVGIARGTYFFIVDSDDILDANAVQFIEDYGLQILYDERFAGIIGAKAYFSKKTLINTKFDVIDATSADMHYKYKLKGDKAEIFKTKVLKDFPFPNVEGEIFCSESLVWNRIAKEYLMRFINKTIYYCEYLNTGLSANSIKLRSNNPTYSLLNYCETVTLDIPLLSKLKAYINISRFTYHYNRRYERKFRDNTGFKLLHISLKPIGYLLYIKDLNNIK